MYSGLRAIGLLVLAAVLSFSANGALPTAELSVPAGSQELARSSQSVSRHLVPLSAAEKVGRELRVQQSLAVTGQHHQTLWQLPKAASLDAAFDGLSTQFDAAPIYHCEGRDCGRSSVWSTLIYGEPRVYGQDRFQRYAVFLVGPNELQTLYAIRRGNQRLLVMHEVIVTTTPLSLEAHSQAYDTLLGSGSLLLAFPDATPTVAGLTDTLERLGAELSGSKAGSVYVVCHLNRVAATEQLLDDSKVCAESAVDALQNAYDAARAQTPAAESANRQRPPDVTFAPFAAGPLLPRADAPANRIELVVPAVLQRK